MDKNTQIALFKGKTIRRTLHQDEWWFVIVDVVSVLTDSAQPDGYLKDMRRRDPEIDKGWGQIATSLPVRTVGGLQKLNCANTEGIFRLIQSIPSHKAEPFKRWLAKTRCSMALRGGRQTVAIDPPLRKTTIYLKSKISDLKSHEENTP